VRRSILRGGGSGGTASASAAKKRARRAAIVRRAMRSPSGAVQVRRASAGVGPAGRAARDGGAGGAGIREHVRVLACVARAAGCERACGCEDVYACVCMSCLRACGSCARARERSYVSERARASEGRACCARGPAHVSARGSAGCHGVRALARGPPRRNSPPGTLVRRSYPSRGAKPSISAPSPPLPAARPPEQSARAFVRAP
jgi:hypothetical protein